MEEVALAAGGGTDYTSPGCHTSKNANGNIITLTLKNNHLIVETEERAVTMEDTRNRKYQDTGCSVIVEAPPGYQNEPSNADPGSSDDMISRVTDQQALVHREEIPEDHSSAFDNAKLFGSTNTGLSQSDLSICSQGSVNPSYRYGNQLEYEAGHFGYPMYGAGEAVLDSSQRKLEASSKWVEFDKSPDTEKTLLEDSKTPSLEKDSSENVSERRNNNNLASSGSSQTDLSSSATVLSIMNGAATEMTNEINSMSTTKPVITGAILKDEASLQEDTFQEQQRKLGNGTLTPEHRRLDEDKNTRSESNNVDVVTRPEGSAFVPTHKRTGSIPPRLIEESIEIERKKTLDIYSQIKTSTKSILPGLSPKFELLQNEVSPVDDKES
ncbi:hypothetical protein TSAR_015139 [Trichomalopsis sarcophagae]|uniref:Uncharacterized protein n=1 Tax=Trichomalopsis sarcophagae TaxID=543379 RepID=A0A232FBD9_9HYME|nr:hypothetical protein TSAR_015139 [Trichomalopsis sarcophagae]